MTGRRIAIILAIVFLVPLAALVALVVVVQSAWAERWVEARASAALHREVNIDTIRLHFGWPPTVTFARLRIANPSWAQTRELVDAKDLSAQVMVPPLFAGKVIVPYLEARSAVAGLEMNGDRASWRFGGESANGPSRLTLGIVKLADGRIRFAWPDQKTDLDIVTKGSLGEGGELQATASGRFRGDEAKASARIPHLDPQNAGAGPIDFSGEATAGRTHVSAQGMFQIPGDVMDFQLTLAGATLKDLNHLVQILLPDTPPYSVQGHLIHHGNDWTFDGFKGKVGNSDLHGSVLYRTGGKRPFLRGDLHSALLDFQDLGPLIGAPPGTGPGKVANAEQRAKSAEREAKNEILPHTEFSVEHWNVMDADVRLESKRIARPHAVAVESLDTHIILNDALLRLDPLDFGYAGGHIKSVVDIDGRKNPVQGHMDADVQGLQLAKLFPEGNNGRDGGDGTTEPKAAKAASPATMNAVKEALGTLYGRAKLDGTGRSVAELLGTSNGRLTLAVNGGQVSDLLVNLLELDIRDVLMLLGTKNKKVELRCAVGGFAVKDGVMDPQAFVVDTEDSQVDIGGSLSLADESLDLKIHPLPKDPSFFSLRTPIDLEGPMRHPKVHLHKGPIAARIAGAIALGVVNPALAILPFVDNGPGKDSDCGRLLAEARDQGAQRKR
jgi:uncharacterized protein involved in outer membrane biogenesis